MRPQRLPLSAPPDELNLQTGFAGTIVGRINEFCKREDVRNEIDREAQARKIKETADSHFEGHKKRIRAGLLASAQTFALGPNILAITLERKRVSDIVISTKKQKGNKNSIHLAENYLH